MKSSGIDDSSSGHEGKFKGSKWLKRAGLLAALVGTVAGASEVKGAYNEYGPVGAMA